MFRFLLLTLKHFITKTNFVLFQEEHSHVTVYLKASPSLIMAHLHKRGQTGDNKITLDDIIQLHNKHETFVKSLSDVVTIDIKDFNDIDEILNQIRLKLVSK